MAYELITNRDLAEGIHVIFQYLNDITGQLFMPLVIFLLYMVMGLGMYFAQKRQTGRGDLPVAFAVSSYIMIGFTVLIGMIPGMINGRVIIEVIVFATVGTLWLYFSKKEAAAGF